MSVIISRALPDARDGLKPSQRRILVAMNDLNLGPSSSTSKCAGIVGETMKRYHPHGEAVIYPTLVRMAQDWNMRHRLVHPQGNFGSLAGLPPAAMRYTEARMTPIAAEMLEDLERDTVDFIDNYDGKYREPLVLPSRFPNLLVNGSDGIAVGMATDIPPHNLGEVCEAAIRIIDNPEISIPEIMEVLPGPDFPTGGIICGRQGILEGYHTGRGKVLLRARAEINEEGTRPQIIIKEVPFQQTRNRLAESIADLVRQEKIKGISAIRDESSVRTGDPVRIVIELKRDADPNLILKQLYQYSPLEKTASIILLALVDGRPRTLNIKELIECFLRHRAQVIRRKTQFLLREAKKRSHILEGQLIAISSLDEIIHICRTSPSRNESKIRLQNHTVAAAVLKRALGESNFASLQKELGELSEYRMTEAQAEAVVRMQLGQLAALESDEVLREYNDLREKINGYELLLSDEKNILADVRKDLVELKDKYSDKRRTEITGEVDDVEFEELIPNETCAITLSHQGYIKRLPATVYRAQHRGGKGVSGGATRDDDFIENFFIADTKDFLLCFTNLGRLYWLKVYQIPQGNRVAQGRSIANVLSLRPEEKISSIIPVKSFEGSGEKSLIMATKNGLVKKTPLSEYSRPRAGGIIGINLEEGDSLIGVALVQGGDEIVLCSRNGMAIRFDQADARDMGRNSKGVKGINLVGEDELVGMVVADPEGFLLTICEKGFGKRTPFGANTVGESADTEETTEEPEAPADENGEAPPTASSMRYRKQRRGGKGVRDIRTGERNGKVVAISSVRESDDIMIITSSGMVNRTHVTEIRTVGRNTMGVRIMNLKEEDLVSTLAKIAPEETTAEPKPEDPPA
ncbi:MAG: DNA gyrase subunit A [Gemmataceae bacterium]